MSNDFFLPKMVLFVK